MRTSFRDPDGVLLHDQERILRVVRAEAGIRLRKFLETDFARRAFSSGSLVRTYYLERATARSIPLLDSYLNCEGGNEKSVFEHDRIAFISYPYEWTAEMLHVAATQTLGLASSLLDIDLSLKDATPYNVLFRGPKPVFVDLLSIEDRNPSDARWLPYAQYVQTFLLPLLAFKLLGVSISESMFSRREGLTPREIFYRLGFFQRLHRGSLSTVTLPMILSHLVRSEQTYLPKAGADHEKSEFLLRSLFSRLANQTNRLRPDTPVSIWTNYQNSRNHYNKTELAAKRDFVEDCLKLTHCTSVLDVGCNTGEFSLLAANSGAAVVAIDSDAGVVSETWRKADLANANVLPLVVNICRPTPAIGWENQECQSFLERAERSFDMVLMLALIHHLIVNERVPLDRIAALCSRLTCRWLILEWVPFSDTKFQEIVRGRGQLYSHTTTEKFEAAFSEHFVTKRTVQLNDSGRSLYLFEKQVPEPLRSHH
jgi:SAM-dependent methyltransferase